MFEIVDGKLKKLETYKYQNEDELQNILFENPQIIYSTETLGLADSETVIACREFSITSGNVDLILINQQADIILIETKLIKNPESSRLVVSQLIDYIKTLVTIDIDTFVEKKKGTEASEMLSDVKRSFFPEAIVSLEKPAGQSQPVRILICKDKVCARPAESAAEALERIRVIRHSL